MIEYAELLKSAAGQIDAFDDQIKALNDFKKDIYANIRETVAPEQFKAWRDAVKLRQKRRVDKDSLEAHDERVWAMLSMLEAPNDQKRSKTAVAPVSAPANAIVEETDLHAQAHEAETADPDTGELSDLPAFLDRRARAAA